jgi:hypothetical protein
MMIMVHELSSLFIIYPHFIYYLIELTGNMGCIQVQPFSDASMLHPSASAACGFNAKYRWHSCRRFKAKSSLRGMWSTASLATGIPFCAREIS